jgi:hypothetical protein
VTLRERLRVIFDAIRGRKPPPVIIYRDPPPEIRAAHPGGHFYSPIVDPADASANAARIWPEPPADVAGVDFDDASHRHVLETLFPRFYPDFDYAEEGASDDELSAYYIRNSQFSWLDARALFVLLREWRLLQRSVFVIDGNGKVAYAEYVSDQMAEPDYDAAVATARALAIS